jgi:hypothetical protein
MKISVNVGKCSLFASFEMACPLCRVVVPANTRHECETKPVEQSSAKKRKAMKDVRATHP